MSLSTHMLLHSQAILISFFVPSPTFQSWVLWVLSFSGFGLDTDFSQDIGSSGCDDLLNYFPVIDTADHLSFDATTEGGVSAEEGNQNMLMQFPPDQDVQQEREQDVKQEQERVQDMKRKQEVGFEVKEYQGHKPELADGAYEL